MVEKVQNGMRSLSQGVRRRPVQATVAALVIAGGLVTAFVSGSNADNNCANTGYGYGYGSSGGFGYGYGQCPNPPPTESAAPGAFAGSVSDPNLLDDPVFAQAGIDSWQVGAGNNRSVFSSTSSPVGSNYVEFNGGSASTATLYQDVAVTPLGNHSYTASIYLRTASGTATASVAVWALGGSASPELGQAQIALNTTWTRYSAVVDVGSSGHAFLRFQIYTSGATLDATGAVLQDEGVNDAGFGQGLGFWTVGSTQYRAVLSNEGQTYLETTSWNASEMTVSQDLGLSVAAGHTYAASALLRSPSGSSIPATVVLWALGGSGAAELGQTQVTLGGSWQQVSTILDVANTGHTILRFQVYADGGQNAVDVTGAQVDDAGVPDGGFGQGIGAWMVPAGANRAIVTGTTGPDGQNWLQANANGGSSTSVWQDLSGTPVAGHAYTASMFLQSISGGPINATVVIWGLGGSAATELGQTHVTVGSSWTQFATALEVANPGHTFLRIQIYVNGSGTIGISGVNLADLG